MSVHLLVRSSYSLLDSTIRIPSLARCAKDLGYDSLVLADHNVMYGCPAFLRACRAEGLRGIIGLEADCLYHDTLVPFLLIAKDDAGVRELMKLSSIICSEKQHCTAEELAEAASRCFLIAYGEGGWFDSALIAEDTEKITACLKTMREELGTFDVALSYQDAELWKARNALLKRICMSLSIRTVALNKVYYLQEDDAEAYRVMCGIRLQKTLRDPSLPHISGRSFLSPARMAELYDADDLKRTDEIAAACSVIGHGLKSGLPSFPVPSSVTAAQYLTQLCLKGLAKRIPGQIPDPYLKRLKYELDVITDMRFEDYFLIVYDFIRFARKAGIYVGPGRGSASGSLVAYSLGITQIDPLRYGLLFERFLNPERISMPDIDTDIPDNRRQEVIDYVYRKYGKEHTALIVTFGTLKARQVIRDVGRVMDIPVRDTDMLCRLIPNPANTNVTLREALESSTKLKQIASAEVRYRKLFETAFRLEGLPRHTSVHAGGVVLSSLPLTDVVPLCGEDDGIRTIQYSMEHLEERGLIKMDFLGLRTLTIIDEIVARVHETDPELRIMAIPQNDPEVYAALQRCDTAGIFQLESAGMKNLLRRMKPVCFEDIVAALALYRPGPMDHINVYLENRAHPEKITYPSPELEPILKDTYGVMLYQEQIMNTAREAAGFTLGKADVLRKAISKKDPKEMEKMKDEFLYGCRKRGYDEDTAKAVFSWIERFAGYGFNRSHAVAYAHLVWQMIWLKVRYPLCFYAALLDASVSDDAKYAKYIEECRRKGISVLAPDISRSGNTCLCENNSVILPLSCVKGIGVQAAEMLAAERAKKSFTDFFDFTARASVLKVSRQAVENLIDAGALDCFGLSRNTMKTGLDEALRYAELVRIDHGGMTLIDDSLVSRPVIRRMADIPSEKSENEKKALGFYLSGHPAADLRTRLSLDVQTIVHLNGTSGEVTGFGIIRKVFQHRTRKGDMMAFLSVADETGEIDVTVMPNLYRQYGNDLARGKYILFHGRMEKENACLADRLKIVNA